MKWSDVKGLNARNKIKFYFYCFMVEQHPTIQMYLKYSLHLVVKLCKMKNRNTYALTFSLCCFFDLEIEIPLRQHARSYSLYCKI